MKQNIYAIRCTIVKNIKKEKKRLNAFLQTQRKNMECATPSIEAWKKSDAYDACFCRNESEKINHLAVGAYVVISFIIQK
ncbi:hypothetical protein EfmAA96_20430 [Enterococcus faecium]|nr:hypothetical protein EfmAA96_20430 [Enterococcus faecium]BDP90684.1 hypothetical protein EfmGK923_08570 [Enterococcus faecium]BDP93870.1 hypothetical protein EfmGK941_08750 [Enterococcus faecium]BDP97048.1 hypothetical protein EfmGK961_08640 [Enterococcus faecium]